MSRADRRTLRLNAVTAAVAVVVGSAACSSGDLADDEPLINRVGEAADSPAPTPKSQSSRSALALSLLECQFGGKRINAPA